MYMAYTNNPHLPRLRMEAVELVRQGWSARKVARRAGFAHNTILGWLKRKPEYGRYGRLVIPTRSSRPRYHPKALSAETVRLILDIRSERSQCAEIIYYRLGQKGVLVSLSSVKRVLRRHHCSRFSRWKKWHVYPPRPLAEKPGILLQIDSLLDGPSSNRLSAYALLDTCSRWGYAEAELRINSRSSARFLVAARNKAPFPFKMVQSDHGSEFSKWFTKVTENKGLFHRHSRVRTPTDNGHVERFIQTLQKECLANIPRTFSSWKREIPEYIHYYNTERPHMGLNMKTPLEVVRSY